MLPVEQAEKGRGLGRHGDYLVGVVQGIPQAEDLPPLDRDRKRLQGAESRILVSIITRCGHQIRLSLALGVPSASPPTN